MKRGRQEGELEVLDMVDCLMLLSKVDEYKLPQEPRRNTSPPASTKVFVCKTCNREFSSFQALGGHRASHKKPRFTDANGGELLDSPVKPKTHECSVCGLEFPIGQALGGHMRRHRAAMQPVAAVMRKSDGNREKAWAVDLNLTPLENDLKLQLMTPFVDCFN